MDLNDVTKKVKNVVHGKKKEHKGTFDPDGTMRLVVQGVITAGVVHPEVATELTAAASAAQLANAAQERAKDRGVSVEVTELEGLAADIEHLTAFFDKEVKIGEKLLATQKELSGHQFMSKTPVDAIRKALADADLEGHIKMVQKAVNDGELWRTRVAAELTKARGKTNRALPTSLATTGGFATELAKEYHKNAKKQFLKVESAIEGFNNSAHWMTAEVESAAIKASMVKNGTVQDIKQAGGFLRTVTGFVEFGLKNNRVTGVVFRAISNAIAAAEMAAEAAELEYEVKNFAKNHALTEAKAKMDKDPLAIARYVMHTRMQVLDLTLKSVQTALQGGLLASPPGVSEIVMPLTDLAKTIVMSSTKQYFKACIEDSEKILESAGRRIEKLSKGKGQVATLKNDAEAAIVEALQPVKAKVDDFGAYIRAELEGKLTAEMKTKMSAAAKKIGLKELKEQAKELAGIETAAQFVEKGDTGQFEFKLDVAKLKEKLGDTALTAADKMEAKLEFAGGAIGMVNFFLELIVDKITKKIVSIFPRTPAQIEDAESLNKIVDDVHFSFLSMATLVKMDFHGLAIKAFTVKEFAKPPKGLVEEYEVGGTTYKWNRTNQAKTRFADDPAKIQYFVSISYAPAGDESHEVWGYYSPATGQWLPSQLDPASLPAPSGKNGWLGVEIAKDHVVLDGRTPTPGTWYHVRCEDTYTAETYPLFVAQSGTHRWASGLEHAKHSSSSVSQSIFNSTAGFATVIPMTKAIAMLAA
ncbi:hypothetical protein [Labedaea rhizosphaerae]|uniref:Uncharacterized protein n=1 Tax=Labedaea rhizosphaerae TaxID=598644 RepID=A0A4R6SG80_LABRH|nr:hypothetical protein [Labedaea rhizosphaerae]TDQ00366.1 hypothetical protein EV186_102227 [Labedaea rhizosphaerae]